MCDCSKALVALIWFAAGVAAASAQAPRSDIPRTTEGRPAFHGVWDASWLTPVERPDAISSVKLSETEVESARKILRGVATARLNAQLGSIGEEGDATELARVEGSWRGAQVVDPPDGKIPFVLGLPPYVASDDGPEAFPPNARCIGGATRPPMTIAPFDMLRRIVQTPTHVVIIGGLGEVRIIRVGSSHNKLASDSGDSIAWWEADALVVETTNFDGSILLRGPPGRSPIRAGGKAVLIERFSFSGPDEIIYHYTLSDPDFYTRPWSAEYNMTRSDLPLVESSCHEGNYSMANMLGGAREMERRAQAAKQ